MRDGGHEAVVTPAGAAVTPEVIAERAAAISAADPNRFSGSLASDRCTISSMCAGISARIDRTDGTGSVTICASTA